MVRLAFLAALWMALPAGAVDPSPTTVNPRTGEGCWALFFQAPNFEDPQGRVPGRLYINSVAGPGMIGEVSDREFFKSARSLIMGPEARLLGYAEPGFRKEVISLEPGQKVRDLREIGFPAQIASLKIVCN